MKRIVKYPMLIVIIALAGWVFPLFRVVPLTDAEIDGKQDEFDVVAFSEDLWRNLKATDFSSASEVRVVLTAIQTDPEQSRQKFGRSVGVGRTCFYCLFGEGTIVSVEKHGVGVSLADSTAPTDLVLKCGLLFGNVVRDATGCVDASKFTNSQQFNSISSELNRIVEERVLPQLITQAEVGKKIRFVGCVEVRVDSKDPRPLDMTPLKIDFL